MVQARPLEIVIDNNQSPGKPLYLAVFSADSDKANWQQEHVRAVQLELPEAETTSIKLELADGRYAIRAFVDSNANGSLDTARFNRPREPFALSIGEGRRDPSIRFRHAIFPVNATHSSITLELVYPDDQPDEHPAPSGEPQ